MSRRRIDRAPELTEWQRRLLLGLLIDDLGEVERFDALLDGDPEKLAPMWQRYRVELLPKWQELRGAARHPMDGTPARLPEPRRARRR